MCCSCPAAPCLWCFFVVVAFNLLKDNSTVIQLTSALPSYFNSGNQLALMLQVSEVATLWDLIAQRKNWHAKPLEQRSFLLHLSSALFIWLARAIALLTPLHCISSCDFCPVRSPSQTLRRAAISIRGPSPPLMMVAHYCCYGNSLNFAVYADLLPLCHVVTTWAHGLFNW